MKKYFIDYWAGYLKGVNIYENLLVGNEVADKLETELENGLGYVPVSLVDREKHLGVLVSYNNEYKIKSDRELERLMDIDEYENIYDYGYLLYEALSIMIHNLVNLIDIFEEYPEMEFRISEALENKYGWREVYGYTKYVNDLVDDYQLTELVMVYERLKLK